MLRIRESRDSLAFQGLQGEGLGALGVTAIVVVIAQVRARGVASEEVVDRDEHDVGDRNGGFLVATVAHDATVAGGQAERTRDCRGGSSRSDAPAQLAK